MENYVLVINNKKGVNIGRKRYTKENAIKRLKEVKAVGIHNMEIMHIDEAFGLK